MNQLINSNVRFIDLGLIEYKKAWDYQAILFDEILKIKTANRQDEAGQRVTPNYVVFCEHPHVFTLGKSGDEKNLLLKQKDLVSVNATFHRINRGGDITYHGPGQLVVYPVIDLENFFTDIHQYMRTLEEAVIQTLKAFGLGGSRITGLTGVWLESGEALPARKICALGVRTSRWVTMHGLALNVNPNLSYFEYIIPCGIADKAVTSMESELGKPVDMAEVNSVLKGKIISLFNMKTAEAFA